MTSTALDTAPATTARRTTPRRRGLPFSAWHLLLMPTAILFAIPFVQMFLAALTPAEDLNKIPTPFIPSRLTLDGFTALFGTSPVLLWLGNTVLVSATAIVSHLVLCSLAVLTKRPPFWYVGIGIGLLGAGVAASALFLG